MTTLSLPARPSEATRPLPWRRMVWVTWRQHRSALIGMAIFLGALAACLWLLGRQLHHAYGLAAACHPSASPACQNLITSYGPTDSFLAPGWPLHVIPPLIGAFLGAPLLARELETGTFRYAWTQGFGRWRWTLAKLVLLAVPVVAVAAALAALFSWYYEPYLTNHNPFLLEVSPLKSGLFDIRGTAFAAWTLTAFAIGALAGVLTRRVILAIGTTLAAYTGLAIAAALYLREHYVTPVTTRNLFDPFTTRPPASLLIVHQWWTEGGRAVNQSAINHQVNAMWPRLFASAPGASVHAKKAHTLTNVMHSLLQHGYASWTSYQPANRFWTFQLIETSWLLALSAALIAATVWLVHRRAC